jgi:hypothetical protein
VAAEASRGEFERVLPIPRYSTYRLFAFAIPSRCFLIVLDHTLTHDSCIDYIYKRELASLYIIATGMTAGIQMHTIPELMLPSPAPGPEAGAGLDGFTWWSIVAVIHSCNHFTLANLMTVPLETTTSLILR